MDRAVSPVVAVLSMTALVLVLGAVVGAGVLGMAAVPADHPPVVLSARVDATSGRIVLVHESGPTIDVRGLRIRIAVDGRRLRDQPTVPFYSTRGYASFPSGPFNPEADPRWELGERASLTATGANAAPIVPGATVRIDLYRDDVPVATTEVTAR